MDTINVSLPTQLKHQADALVEEGHFASFSDLVRTALRKILADVEHDSLMREAIRDHEAGKTIVLKNKKDIATYFRSKKE